MFLNRSGRVDANEIVAKYIVLKLALFSTRNISLSEMVSFELVERGHEVYAVEVKDNILV